MINYLPFNIYLTSPNLTKPQDYDNKSGWIWNLQIWNDSHFFHQFPDKDFME